MTLEHTLHNAAAEWLAEGALSPEQAVALEALIRQRAEKRRARRRMGGAAAVAALLLLPLLSPGMRAWAETTFPWVTQYIGSREPVKQGWAVAQSDGLFQEVLAVAQDKGYTFRVHRILAGPTNTTIIYSVEGTDPQEPHFWGGGRIEGEAHDGLGFNGEGFMRFASGHGEIIDGVYVGSLELNELPAEEGTLTIAPHMIGQVQGNWKVSVPVTKAPLTALSRAVSPDVTLDMGGYSVQVTKIDLVPTETVVHLTYNGALPGPNLAMEQLVLVTPDGELEPTGLSGHGSFDADGNGTYTYRAEFGPLPAGTAQLTLRVDGIDVVHQGQTLRVPLNVGAQAEAPDLPPVEVVSVEADHADIQYPHPESGRWNVYEEWYVIDDQGTAYRALGGASDENGVTTRRITFELMPSGRRAVAAEAREPWHRLEGPWEVTISLSP